MVSKSNKSVKHIGYSPFKLFIIDVLIEINSYLNNDLELCFGMLELLNKRLIYIEENLGTLTREEYTYTGTCSLKGYEWAATPLTVPFDRIFLEAPSVTVVLKTNPDNKFGSPYVSDITTSGCTINIGYSASTVRYCEVQYTAIGFVQKSL